MDTIYLLQIGLDYEGNLATYVFPDLPSAAAKFEEVTAAIKSRSTYADWAKVDGPCRMGAAVTYDTDPVMQFHRD